LSVVLAGCPKQPEIAETAPKAIGPQGAIAKPAFPLPAPPIVSGVPATALAPAEKSPTEVQEASVAPEPPVEKAESPPVEGAEVSPEDAAALQARLVERDMKAKTDIKEGEAQPKIPEAAKEAQVPRVLGTEIKEAEVTPGTQAKGAEVDAVPGVSSPPGAEPSTERVPPAAAGPVAVAPQPPAPAAVAEAPKPPDLTVKDIFFDFDQAMIRDDSRRVLAENIQWLRANPASRVTIEGHCDERGSSEYNLALGERRARVTREFLLAGGIEAKRINTISYGKERPFVLGHDESAWKWNRRAHFVLTTK